jgi:histidine ammonia-lyase
MEHFVFRSPLDSLSVGPLLSTVRVVLIIQCNCLVDGTGGIDHEALQKLPQGVHERRDP